MVLETASLRQASEAEAARWTELIKQTPGGGEVWQTREYAKAKAFQGYREHLVVGDDFPATLVLVKRVPLLGQIWYVPGGPAADGTDSTIDQAARLAAYAKKNGAFLLKVEPRVLRTEDSLAAFKKAGFHANVRILPNESTVLLDVSGDEAEVMGRFSSSTRTRIRKADKTGFEARRVEANDENCRIMYALLGETGDGRFALRPYEYYRDFWQTFQAAGMGQLVLGYADGVPVAGMFGIVAGHTSCYKDGASTRAGELPNGAMNRMQWELILWGRENGATVHDLCGAPRSDQLEDREHPLFGVGQYKLRFSKEVTDYVGVYDLPLRGFATRIWDTIGDRIARRVSLAVRHDAYY